MVRRRLPARVLPRGARDAVLQLALWGLADLCYEGVRGIVTGERSAALANASSIVHIEQALGIFHEGAFQRLFIHSHFVIDVANYVYANAQFTVNLAFMIFLYFFRNHVFYFVRNMFFVAMGMALVVHLALPVAPPRMLTQYGFVDTIQQIAHINQDKGAISLFVNPYAAVPSVHMCFALLVGVTGFRLSRSRLRGLWFVYPVVVLASVVVTANHFFLDAAAGAVVALAAALTAQFIMSRMRPAHWAWIALPAGRISGSQPSVGAEAGA